MARRRLRLSADEIAQRMARNGNKIVPRTYLRWEARGEVPRDAVQPLAVVLGLDAGQLLADQPTQVQWQQVGAALVEFREAVAGLVELPAALENLRREQTDANDRQVQLIARLERAVTALEQREAAK